jgi:hypothetical protein
MVPNQREKNTIHPLISYFFMIDFSHMMVTVQAIRINNWIYYTESSYL